MPHPETAPTTDPADPATPAPDLDLTALGTALAGLVYSAWVRVSPNRVASDNATGDPLPVGSPVRSEVADVAGHHPN
jgi:hypothetical protein